MELLKRMRFLILFLSIFLFIASSVVAQDDEDFYNAGNNNLSNYYCTKLQPLIDNVAKAVVSHDSRRAWKRSINLKTYLEQDYPKSEGEAELYMNLVIAIMDWGESVDQFPNSQDFGSLEKNKELYSEITSYLKKEEGILHYCPSLKFPDFSYWNKIIGKNNSNKSIETDAE